VRGFSRGARENSAPNYTDRYRLSQIALVSDGHLSPGRLGQSGASQRDGTMPRQVLSLMRERIVLALGAQRQKSIETDGLRSKPVEFPSNASVRTAAGFA